MWFVMPAGTFFLILAILYGLGFGAAVSITAWLLEHALIVSIIYVIIRIIAFYQIMIEYDKTKTISGWFFSIIQFFITPIWLFADLILGGYFKAGAEINTEGVIDLLIVVTIGHAVDSLWVKASEDDTNFGIGIVALGWGGYSIGMWIYMLTHASDFFGA